MNSDVIDVTTKKCDVTGLNKATAVLTLPPITIAKYANDVDDLRYKIQQGFNEIIDELVDQALPRN